MKITMKNGSVIHVEPVAILETKAAKIFLANCPEGVAPHVSFMQLRDGLSGDYVLHAVEGPAIAHFEAGFGTVAEEYWHYGVRHRVGGKQAWARWEKRLLRELWEYGVLIKAEKHPMLAAEQARVEAAG